jgi:hypothetical protein
MALYLMSLRAYYVLHESECTEQIMYGVAILDY